MLFRGIHLQCFLEKQYSKPNFHTSDSLTEIKSSTFQQFLSAALIASLNEGPRDLKGTSRDKGKVEIEAFSDIQYLQSLQTVIPGQFDPRRDTQFQF